MTARVIDLAALFGPEACWGPAALSQAEGRRGAALEPPREGSRERGKTGRDRTPATADPTRPAPRRHAPGLALRRSKDHAVPSRLKRIARSPAQEPDGRGPPQAGRRVPARRTPGGREL